VTGITTKIMKRYDYKKIFESPKSDVSIHHHSFFKKSKSKNRTDRISHGSFIKASLCPSYMFIYYICFAILLISFVRWSYSWGSQIIAIFL